MKTNLKKSLLALWVAFMIGLTACGSTSQVEPPSTSVEPITQSQTETAETTASDQTVPTDSSSYSTDISDLPVYSGEPYVPINNNIPAFTDSDFTTTSFEHYSELDSLGHYGAGCSGRNKPGNGSARYIFAYQFKLHFYPEYKFQEIPFTLVQQYQTHEGLQQEGVLGKP